MIGVQGGSRSKRQGWTRPAGRDGAPGADVTAVRGTPCAFAPGVAGHTTPLPQAGRGEPRCRRGTFTCATCACATSPSARLKEQDIVELDEERKAAMVSNLLVVLCSEQATQQVVNTGSLYQ